MGLDGYTGDPVVAELNGNGRTDLLSGSNVLTWQIIRLPDEAAVTSPVTAGITQESLPQFFEVEFLRPEIPRTYAVRWHALRYDIDHNLLEDLTVDESFAVITKPPDPGTGGTPGDGTSGQGQGDPTGGFKTPISVKEFDYRGAPESDVVHLSFPFRYTDYGEGTQLAENAQDSIDDIADCVTLIALTPTGTRPERPDLGINDPTFSSPFMNINDLLGAVTRNEPRAHMQSAHDKSDLVDLLDRAAIFVSDQDEVIRG